MSRVAVLAGVKVSDSVLTRIEPTYTLAVCAERRDPSVFSFYYSDDGTTEAKRSCVEQIHSLT